MYIIIIKSEFTIRKEKNTYENVEIEFVDQRVGSPNPSVNETNER